MYSLNNVPTCSFYSQKYGYSRWNSVATPSGSWDIACPTSYSGLRPPPFIPTSPSLSHRVWDLENIGIAVQIMFLICLQVAMKVSISTSGKWSPFLLFMSFTSCIIRVGSKTANIKIVVLQSWHIFTRTCTIAIFYLKCKIVRTCDFFHYLMTINLETFQRISVTKA